MKKTIPDRPDCEHFLEQIAADFSRLTESSPEIPTSVVKSFKWRFKDWIEADRAVAHYLNGLRNLEVAVGGVEEELMEVELGDEKKS